MLVEKIKSSHSFRSLWIVAMSVVLAYFTNNGHLFLTACGISLLICRVSREKTQKRDRYMRHIGIILLLSGIVFFFRILPFALPLAFFDNRWVRKISWTSRLYFGPFDCS